MPEVPLVSGRRAVNALKRLGFVVDHQTGSHVILKRRTPQGTDTCVIPMHDEIKRRTLASALEKANVKLEDFIAALRS